MGGGASRFSWIEASGVGIGMVVGDGITLFRCTASCKVFGDIAHISPTGADDRLGNTKRVCLVARKLDSDPNPDNGNRSHFKSYNDKTHSNSMIENSVNHSIDRNQRCWFVMESFGSLFRSQCSSCFAIMILPSTSA